MRLIKLALFSIIFLFLIATAISSLLPSTIIVSRAIDIHSSTDSVYALVRDVSRWSNWLADYDTTNNVLSTTGNGAIKMNATNVVITNVTPAKISSTWQVNQGRKMVGEFNFIKGKDSLNTTLQWAFTQKIKWYPWEKFASILSDKALGPYMEKSLDNLKLQAEQ